MNNAFVFGKKAFTWTVVVATIAWAMSAAFIAIPLTAKAATLTAGDLIVGTALSSSGPGRPVYYYGADGKKYLFPSSKTYNSWYGTSFTAVKNLTQAEVDAVPAGDKNTTAKPGACVQFVNDSVLYVVDGSSRRATDATTCPSADVLSIPEGFRANYSAGAAWSGERTALGTSANLGTVLGSGTVATTPATTGALTVALASDNPAGAVVPQGASSAVLLKVNITAGATAQTVTGLTVKAVGVGAAADLSNVYVYEGASRLTSGRTLASQTRSTEFGNLNLSVGANSSRMLSIVADISATAIAGDTHAMQVTTLATTATVSGLPLSGNTISIGSQDVSAVQTANGTAPANPTIGQQAAPISEFRLTAGVNDAELRRITVTIGGTVTVADLSAFTLWQGGVKIADGTLSSDRVTFDLASAPFTMPQGVQRVFTIKANVGGRSGRTIITYVDSVYPTDLLATDKLYGYGATVNFGADTTCDATEFCSSTTGVTVTTQGGKVTVAFNGPAASDVSIGAQDAPLFKLSLSAADQAVEVRRLAISLDGTAALDEMSDDDSGTQVNFFTDIKVKDADTGSVLMGPAEITATGDVVAAQAFTFTDSWNLDAGKTRNLLITADVRNTTDADLVDNGYQVTLTAFTATSIRETSTGQYLAVTDIVGGGTAIAGNTMTVRASALTVNMAAVPASGSTVKGSQGVQMVGFAFVAGISSDVKVTQIVLAGEGNDTDLAFGGDGTANVDDLILSATLWDGTTQIGAAKSPSSTGTLTFDSLQWNIGAGQTKLLVAKVNLSTTLLAGAVDYVTLGVNDVTGQDKDSNTITETNNAANANGVSNYLTINSAGTLSVALDGDTPVSALVVSGTQNQTMAKVKFTAARESYLVKRLRVVNTSGGASDDLATADGMFTAVKLTYKAQDGTTKTKTGVLSSGVANISDLDMYVGVDKTEVLTISGDISDMNQATGRTSVLTPRLGLDFGLAGDTNFEAVGVGSNSSLTLGTDVTAGTSFTNDLGSQDADVVGNTMSVVKSKPTVTLAASSPSGAAVPGLNEVLRFTVAADAAGDVELARISFKVNSTDNNGSTATDWNQPGENSADTACTILTPGTACDTDTAGVLDVTNFHVYESSDLNTEKLGSWVLYDSTGTDVTASEAVGFARLDFTTNQTIAAGSSKTYVLKVDTTGASSANDDTFRMDVVGDTAQFAGAADSATNGNLDTTPETVTTLLGSRFAWGETSSNSVAATRNATSTASTFLTGYLVKNLDVTGGTLVY